MFKYGRLAKINRFNTRWISSSHMIRNDFNVPHTTPNKAANSNLKRNINIGTKSQEPKQELKINEIPVKSEVPEEVEEEKNDDTIMETQTNESGSEPDMEIPEETTLQQKDARIKTGEITESLLGLEDESVQEDLGEEDYLTTVFEKMEPYMDTYAVFKELQKAGFSDDQSNEIISLLLVQLNFKLSKLSTKYSQLFELENERYLFESAQQELRVDITRSRETHNNELINLINILERDFQVISDELNNDFLQLKNNNEVTINDQKQENTLSSKKIMLKIQETNHKITTELNSASRSEIESLRWHLSRWGLISILVCIFSGCATFYVFKKNETIRETKDEFIPLVIYEPSEIDDDDYHTDLDESDV